jgi:4-amino-4-deoxy-L-arabinose transferase-like glycosyltransferase
MKWSSKFCKKKDNFEIMNKSFISVLCIIIITTYLCAINVDTMDVDASQYASMSREMKESGSYLQVYEQGKDYLDKPPFLFWINSLSMNLFGENNFAFKLPSILFALLAIFATYRFAKLFYNDTIALLCAIVLASCQALFLITNDIRTDTILMSWTIVAMWQLAEWVQHKKLANFILGSIAIGFGMVTKGPIALFATVFAFGSHFLLKRNFSYLFKPVYLLGIIIIALVLVPMSIGLYKQFDLHPEKTVIDLKNVSGLKFFYWTQSFGRITGDSAWDNNAGFGFLFEGLLWGLIPWILFFIAGLVISIVKVIKSKFASNSQVEFISLGGFVLTYCSLGMSKYQLPHYIYVVLPLIAIITGKALYDIFWEQQYPIIKKIIIPIQIILCLTLIVVPVLILQFTFKPSNLLWYAFPATAAIVAIFLLAKKISIPKIFTISLSLIILFNLFITSWFYPNLLNYQCGNVVGRYVTDNGIAKDQFFTYKFEGNRSNLHFYAKRIVAPVTRLDSVKSNYYVLTADAGLNDIKKLPNSAFTIVKTGKDFHVSQLNSNFLNWKKRDQELVNYYLVKIIQ